MADSLAEELKQGVMLEVDKQFIQNFLTKAQLATTSFYAEAEQILTNSILSQHAGSTVYDKLQGTLQNDDLSKVLYDNLIKARNRAKSQKRIIELSQLVAKGYRILTELGEELRGNNILYGIYIEGIEDGQRQLKVGELSLDEFLTSMQLNKSGELVIQKSLLPSTLTLHESILSDRYMLFREEEENEIKSLIDNFNAQIRTIKDKTSLIQLINESFGATSKSKRKILNKLNKTNNISDNLIEDIISRHAASKRGGLNRGRAVEKAAAMYNKILNKFSYSENTKFYQDADYTLNNIEYQAKMIESSAGVKISSILNGLQELTTIVMNANQKIGEAIASSVDGAEELAYQAVFKDIEKLFTKSG